MSSWGALQEEGEGQSCEIMGSTEGGRGGTEP